MFWARARGCVRSHEPADLCRWVVLAGLGLALTGLAVRLEAPLGTAGAPFIGSYRFRLDAATVLAPVVAIAVLVAVARGAHRRLPWPALLAAAYGAALAWTLALAVVDGTDGLTRPVLAPDEYLVDVPAVGGDPAGFLAGFVAHSTDWSVATRQHPPGPVLLLWLITRAGLTAPLAIGALLTAVGVLTVPLVLASVRSLCHEPAARRLAPILVLAPYAVWVAVSMDAVTSTLGAAMVTCGVLASQQRRGVAAAGWAAGCGLLLGVAALFSYAVAWLALSVICVYFVRRRALLNVVTGAFALVPLALAEVAGFVWTDGLTAAQADFSVRVEPQRSAVLWGFLSLVVLVLACGPAIVTSARQIRRTPGWPFLVGAAVAVGFAVGAGLARGEMERAWLPYFPWLLVAAGESAGGPREQARAPVLSVAAGALTAVVLEAVLLPAW